MRRVFLALVSVFTAVSAVKTDGSGQLRSGGIARSFVQALEFQHVLRICNTYPYSAKIGAYMGKQQIGDDLEYKQCTEFFGKLKDGAKIDFKVSESTVGTFTISELPKADAKLLIVIFRHDSKSRAVSFESHVFSKNNQAQVAVIDTYKGNTTSKLHVQDRKQRKDGKLRSELLRFDSVVAVTPGFYDVVLLPESGNQTVAKAELRAAKKEAYIVLRCGMDGDIDGERYPEELVVFPQSDRNEVAFQALEAEKEEEAMERGAASARNLWFAVPIFIAGLMF